MSDKLDYIERDVYNAVQSAIWNGVSAEDFKKAVARAWQIVLDEEKRRSDRVLSQ